MKSFYRSMEEFLDWVGMICVSPKSSKFEIIATICKISQMRFADFHAENVKKLLGVWSFSQ